MFEILVHQEAGDFQNFRGGGGSVHAGGEGEYHLQNY